MPFETYFISHIEMQSMIFRESPFYIELIKPCLKALLYYVVIIF